MMQVKIFQDSSHVSVQNEINLFFKKKNVEVKQILQTEESHYLTISIFYIDLVDCPDDVKYVPNPNATI